MLLSLQDGTQARLRAIEPGDSYLTEVDGDDHIALVAVLDGAPEQIVAVARCVRLAPGADNDAAQRLLATLAVRLEHRVAHVGVRELVAELPGCEAVRLAA